jgi:hypothetical protein
VSAEPSNIDWDQRASNTSRCSLCGAHKYPNQSLARDRRKIVANLNARQARELPLDRHKKRNAHEIVAAINKT